VEFPVDAVTFYEFDIQTLGGPQLDLTRQYHEATTERHRRCALNFVATCHEIRDPHTCNFVAAPRNSISSLPRCSMIFP